MYTLQVSTNKRNELIDITDEVQQQIAEENFTQGMIVLYVPHTTAAVTINEGADPSVKEDIIQTLATLIPVSETYQHLEGNSDAHIKASLLGASAHILVENGRLVLGTWQHIFFFEGDGPRKRKIYLQLFPLDPKTRS
jgi:secondary thiamine-phosphate synthase enzyme